MYGNRISHIQNLGSTWVKVKSTLLVNFAVCRTVYFQIKDEFAHRILRK